MFTALCFVVALARPDIAPSPLYRKGENLAPSVPTAVAMLSETVTVTVGEDTATVRAVFKLLNTSDKAEAMEVGFPNSAMPAGSLTGVSSWDTTVLQEFKARVDGSPVTPEAKRHPDAGKEDYDGWLCWQMTFEPGQPREVEVDYRVVTQDDAYTKTSPLRNREVSYILKTGAGWHGPIGSAEVTFDLGSFGKENILEALPAPARSEEHRLVWKWTDFEPQADIVVRYRVFKDAKDAIAKLGPRAQATKDPMLLLDYADNLEADGRHLEAAEVFKRLHGIEEASRGRSGGIEDYVQRPWSRVNDGGLLDDDGSYVPPAMRAASNLRMAGRTAEASEWARRAIDRWCEVQTRLTIQELGGHMLGKLLRVAPENIGWRIDELRDWTDASVTSDPWEVRGKNLTTTVRAAVDAAVSRAESAGTDRWAALRAYDEAGGSVERELRAALSPLSVPAGAITEARAVLVEMADTINKLAAEVETDEYEASVPWRDLLAPPAHGDGPWKAVGAVSFKIEDGVLVVDFLDPPKGELRGVLALDGWTLPWHDIVLVLDLEMAGSGYGWSLDFRYRPDQPSQGYLFHSRDGRDDHVEGVRHRVTVRVKGRSVPVKVDDQTWTTKTYGEVRNLSGGVAIRMFPNHRMTIREAKLKLLRPREK